MIIVIVALVLLSYLYGCFSFARVLAKSVRSLNIYKVGTGLADTENIYFNISKPLGIMSGILDITKSYAWLYILRQVLLIMDRTSIPPDLSVLYSYDLMLLCGAAMLIGHCLPLTNRLRGGRGISTYFGIIAFFVLVPALVTGILVLTLIWGFKQVRFAQYTTVIMPVLLSQVFSSVPELKSMLPLLHTSTLFTTKLLGIAILMGILNIAVSKKLGEF